MKYLCVCGGGDGMRLGRDIYRLARSKICIGAILVDNLEHNV